MDRTVNFAGYKPGCGAHTDAGERLAQVARHMIGLHHELAHSKSLKDGQILQQRLNITQACFNARVASMLRAR